MAAVAASLRLGFLPNTGISKLSLAPKSSALTCAADTADVASGATICGMLSRSMPAAGLGGKRRPPTLQQRYCILRWVPLFVYYKDAKDNVNAPEGVLLANAYTTRRVPAAGLPGGASIDGAGTPAGDEAVRLILEPVGAAADEAYELVAASEKDASAWIAAFAGLQKTPATGGTTTSAAPTEGVGGDGGTGSSGAAGGAAPERESLTVKLRRTTEELARAQNALEIANVQKLKLTKAYQRDVAAVTECVSQLAITVAQLQASVTAMSAPAAAAPSRVASVDHAAVTRLAELGAAASTSAVRDLVSGIDSLRETVAKTRASMLDTAASFAARLPRTPSAMPTTPSTFLHALPQGVMITPPSMSPRMPASFSRGDDMTKFELAVASPAQAMTPAKARDDRHPLPGQPAPPARLKRSPSAFTDTDDDSAAEVDVVGVTDSMENLGLDRKAAADTQARPAAPPPPPKRGKQPPAPPPARMHRGLSARRLTGARAGDAPRSRQQSQWSEHAAPAVTRIIEDRSRSEASYDATPSQRAQHDDSEEEPPSQRQYVRHIKLLSAFFSLYAPRKVEKVHEILRHFRGREPALFALLERTYMRPIEAPILDITPMQVSLQSAAASAVTTPVAWRRIPDTDGASHSLRNSSSREPDAGAPSGALQSQPRRSTQRFDLGGGLVVDMDESDDAASGGSVHGTTGVQSTPGGRGEVASSGAAAPASQGHGTTAAASEASPSATGGITARGITDASLRTIPRSSTFAVAPDAAGGPARRPLRAGARSTSFAALRANRAGSEGTRPDRAATATSMVSPAREAPSPYQIVAELPHTIKAAQAKNGGAPAWIPDDASAECMLCSRAFGIWAGKHHCRNCGRLVCDSCSPAALAKPIPEFGHLTPVRVCRDCHYVA